MLYKVLVMLHILGASLWIGGRAALVGVAIPRAMRTGDVDALREFETGIGRIGLGALVVQLVTGLWLVFHWLGGFDAELRLNDPILPLALIKLGLYTAVFCLVGYTHHRLLLRLEPRDLRAFNAYAWLTAALSVALLVVGVAIRTGGVR